MFRYFQIAKRQGVVNPENTFYSVKRFIGRRMDEVDEESKVSSLGGEEFSLHAILLRRYRPPPPTATPTWDTADR